MLISSQLPIDPTSVKIAHLNDGLQLQLLNKTNSMEFRLIDGAGEGFFLLDNEQMAAIASATVTLRITDSFTGDNQNFTVRVINKFSLLPMDISDRYMVLNVAEEKYDLKKLTVDRNYNLIKRETIDEETDPDYWPPDDASLKTLEQIITEISGMSVTYTATTYTPIEVNIQGMDVLSAVDILCRAYGLLWTVSNGDLKVFEVTEADEPTQKDISDIRQTTLTRQMAEFEVTYPVVSNGLQRNSRIAKKVTHGTQGEYVCTYMPFFPAVVSKTEVIQNEPELEALATALDANFEGIMNIESNYLAYHAYKTNIGASVLHYSLTFADYGSGPRTLYDARKYPFLTIPQPYTFDQDLQTGETVIAVFELTSALLSGVGNTATATVVVSNSADTPGTITVINTGMSQAYTTARGLALKVKDESDEVEWWVIEVDQFALMYTAKLTANTHGFSGGGTPTPGSYADQAAITATDIKVLTPYPFSYYETQAIANPFNFHGIPDDIILVQHVEDDYSFTLNEAPTSSKNIVVGIYPAKSRRFSIQLTSDAPTGTNTPTLTAKGWGPIANNSGEIPGGGESPVDRFYRARNAAATHRGIVSLDLYNTGGDPVYVVENCEHIATVVRGTFADDFCNTPTTYEVDCVQGLDGTTPATITVQNIYGTISGVAGDPAPLSFWDNVTGEWYPDATVPPTLIIEYVIESITTAATGPYTGLKVATVSVKGTVPTARCIACTVTEVVDHSGCIFDVADMTGYTGWGYLATYVSVASGAAPGELSPPHFAAFNRCCAPDSGTYGDCI